MKKFILLAVILTTVAIAASAQNIDIINKTSCNIQVVHYSFTQPTDMPPCAPCCGTPVPCCNTPATINVGPGSPLSPTVVSTPAMPSIQTFTITIICPNPPGGTQQITVGDTPCHSNTGTFTPCCGIGTIVWNPNTNPPSLTIN